MPDLVGAAPEPRMLGNRKNDAAIAPGGITQAAQRRLVVDNVFQDIEGADDVERRHRRDGLRVHLHQLHRGRQPAARNRQSGGMQIRTGEPRPRTCGRKRAENRARAASDFQEAFRCWKIAVAEADDQFVASDEPEVAGVDTRQNRKQCGIVAGRGLVQFGREQRDSILAADREPAGGAPPPDRPGWLLGPNRLSGAAEGANPLRGGRRQRHRCAS